MCPVTVTLCHSCTGCRALLCQLWGLKLKTRDTASRQPHGDQQATGRRHIALLASGAISHIALLLSSVRTMLTSLVRQRLSACTLTACTNSLSLPTDLVGTVSCIASS